MANQQSLEPAAKAAIRRRPDAESSRRPAPELHPLLALQRQVGNAPIARMLAQRAGGMEEEKEEEGGAIQAAREPALAQRQGPPEEEKREDQGVVQAEAAEVGPEGGPIGAALAARIQTQRGSGALLDEGTRTAMESSFGASFADVRLHTDGESEALNRSLGARAFTTGSDIFFRRSAYQPGTDAGHRLLGHELAHVIQQRSMSVSGPLKVGPAGDSYEQQADAVAHAVAEMPAAAPTAQRQAEEQMHEVADTAADTAAVQRQAEEEEAIQRQEQEEESMQRRVAEEEEEETAGAA